MKTCCRSSLILIQLIHFTILPVLEAQEAKVEPGVRAYLGQDVTLPCHFIPGQKGGKITQVNWELMQRDREQFLIIVSHHLYGVDAFETFLKERVEMTEQSLTIRNVEMRDAGLYTCTIFAFPYGSVKGRTNLIVQEQKPSSSGTVAAIVTVTILLLVMMAGVAYHVCIRRAKSSAREHVFDYTDGPVVDVYRSPVPLRKERDVYSEVKYKLFSGASSTADHKHPETMAVDEFTSVAVLYWQP